LKTAVAAGVDVRIMIPEKSDTKWVHWGTMSYLQELMKAGIKIYMYRKGFLHSKLFVCDDCLSSVGSTNMDFRSLYLHFECGTLMYQTECVAQLKADAMNTFTECREISLADCENKNIVIQMLLSILHLFAPLL
jgi:cardiolipin synthase